MTGDASWPHARGLPIAAVLDEICRTFDVHTRAVLVAPPGAGKTTAVAPALLTRDWCGGQLWLLGPRRLAVRAAAEHMAAMAGESIGGRIGYATRLDSRHGANTRILVMTAGIFRQRIIADPALSGVSAVLFDEVHERSVDGDFSLALAIEAQAALRPDLRLLAMSATLDGARFARLLDDAPVLESMGRAHPLDVQHRAMDGALPLEANVAATVQAALAERDDGDVLVFLPGQRDIARTAALLDGRGLAVLPLHGALDPAEQRRALAPDADGRRKIILSTAIAESSLTIDGVRIVVDSGLARRARFDPGAGLIRLVTERASQAAATQRAGRAARQGPGTVWRMWAPAATGAMAPFDPPEITDADLAPLLLDCAAWGVSDPASMAWLDAPPAPALAEARARLTGIGALDDAGHISPHGRAITALPLPPNLAHMLLNAAAQGAGEAGARLAVLLTETGLGGRSEDVDQRLARWRSEAGQRAKAAAGLAQRLARLALTKADAGAAPTPAMPAIGALLATAFPDRVARRRDARGEEWLSVGGRGFRLDAASPLATADWLAVAEVQGAARSARILSAARLEEADALGAAAAWLREDDISSYDAAADRIDARRETRLGAILLKRQDASLTPAQRGAILIAAVRERGLAILPIGDAVAALRARAAFASVAGLDDDSLRQSLELWLEPLLGAVTRLGQLSDGALAQGLRQMLPWDAQAALDRLAPVSFTTPAGSSHAIDYAADGGPTVTVRVQALFGLAEHPCIGTPPMPLTLSLTSPAGRPIQTTRDLPGFWRGSWADVRREMRGRYPKHPWPDAPWDALATLRTKRRYAAP